MDRISMIESANVENRMLFIENSKEFQCSICLKYFSRKFTLDMHLLIHKGIKPHPCPFCGKCFRQKGTLMRHKALHSASNLFHCSLCNRGFRQKNVFLHHLKHRHNVSTETLDRRKYRTELKDYQSIMDTLPSFVMADSTAIASSEKHLDAMLFETMNEGLCESTSENTSICYQNDSFDTDTLSRNTKSDLTSLKNNDFVSENVNIAFQKLRYECDKCCSQFMDYIDYSEHVAKKHNNDQNLLDRKPSHFPVPVSSENEYICNSYQLRCPEKETEHNYLTQTNPKNALLPDPSVKLPGSNEKRTEESHNQCIPCHPSFTTDGFDSHVQSALTTVNVNLQENSCIKTPFDPLSVSVNRVLSPEGDTSFVPRELSSRVKLLSNETLPSSKNSFSENSIPENFSRLPAKSNLSANFTKNLNITKKPIEGNQKIVCPFCDYYCNNNINFADHLNKHMNQEIFQIKKSNFLCKTSKINKNIIKPRNKKSAKLSNAEIYPPSFTQLIRNTENLCRTSRCQSTSVKNFSTDPSSTFYSCKICNKTFKKIQAFEYHRQMHLNVRSFCCDQCGKRFPNKHFLLRHTRLTHMKTYKCNVCSRAFSYHKLYSYHVKNCSKFKPTEVFKNDMKFPLVEIKKLLESDVSGIVGVIPLYDKGMSNENFKVGIPIFSPQCVKNIARLPLLDLSLPIVE